jgi:C4-dicarboxylate transporter, DctM subunit
VANPSSTPAAGMERRPVLLARLFHGFENGVGILAILAMAVLPIAEIVGRRFLGQGVKGSITWVQHLTLWVAFVGGIIAARDRRHLALATTTFLSPSIRTWADLVGSAVGCSVAAVLAWAAYCTVETQRPDTTVLSGGVAIWVMYTIMPIGFVLIAIRMWWQAGLLPPHNEFKSDPATAYSPAVAWTRRALVLAVVLAAFSLAWVPEASVAAWRWAQ